MRPPPRPPPGPVGGLWAPRGGGTGRLPGKSGARVPRGEGRNLAGLISPPWRSLEGGFPFPPSSPEPKFGFLLPGGRRAGREGREAAGFQPGSSSGATPAPKKKNKIIKIITRPGGAEGRGLLRTLGGIGPAELGAQGGRQAGEGPGCEGGEIEAWSPPRWSWGSKLVAFCEARAELRSAEAAAGCPGGSAPGGERTRDRPSGTLKGAAASCLA